VLLGMTLANDALLTGVGGLTPAWLLRFPFMFLGTLISLALNPWGLLLVALGMGQGWSLARRGTPVPADLKDRMLGGLPETLEFGQAYPDQFPHLDRARLQEWTEALQELGFRWVSDFRPSNMPEGAPAAMARLFIHDEERCYAEVGQVFPLRALPPPLQCSIFSVVGTAPDNAWRLATNTVPPDGAAYLLRRPWSFWTRHPDMAPGDLFRTHLARRAGLQQRYGGEPLPVSSDGFFALLNTENAARRERIRELPVAEIVRAGHLKDGPSEWLG
jgi:hypothetical protein